jgi:hypothetical protein
MASIEQALNSAQESVKEAEKSLREAQTEKEKEFWRGRLEAREAQVSKLVDVLAASTVPSGNDFVTRALGT